MRVREYHLLQRLRLVVMGDDAAKPLHGIDVIGGLVLLDDVVAGIHQIDGNERRYLADLVHVRRRPGARPRCG